ncbi:alpha-2,3-sialyltransferase [Tritonibacter mobilis]|uniref:alpha-2,3-sialyltransferase n=1 Tax=Tritonibacter mobilis TaxID=379347 RepID=UPI0008068240|nr:alpha-2,3-sialyltransferase [Tritonibacter mobilis]
MQLRDRPVVVAGNGTSLAQIPQSAILADDFIIRTNNFFFEQRFHLGRRVDLAFMGGDPRVAPFMFETLYRCRSDYDLGGWSSHNPRVIRAGRRRFGQNFYPMRYRDTSLETRVRQLISRHGRHPTTGIYAVLMAHGLGAETILLAGMDFYGTRNRYPFSPGPHYRALMGQDLAHRGFDHHLHDLELDHAILRLLQARGDVRLLRLGDSPVLRDVTTPTPDRGGRGLDLPRTAPPTDWASRAGLYPIGALKALRRGKTALQGIKKRVLPQ